MKAIGSWAQVPLGALGAQAAKGNPEMQAIGNWEKKNDESQREPNKKYMSRNTKTKVS